MDQYDECGSLFDQYIQDAADDIFLAPSAPPAELPPLSNDDLLAWLNDLDRGDPTMAGDDQDTASVCSSAQPAPTNSYCRSSRSPRKQRDRAAHSRYERRRRAKINKKIKTLKELVPTSHKNDNRAKLLEKTIEHIKQLQERRIMGSMAPQMEMCSVAPMDRRTRHAMPMIVHPMAFVPLPGGGGIVQTSNWGSYPAPDAYSGYMAYQFQPRRPVLLEH